MKRNVITSAIALAFGLTGPVWATGNTDSLDDASASTGSFAGGAVIGGSKNKADQSGGTVDLHFTSGPSLVDTGNNLVDDSYNGWKGVAQNAQNSGVESLTQQNAAIQVNEGDDSTATASATDQSAAAAVDLAGAKNIASQRGTTADNIAGDVTAGDNRITDSYNHWTGVSQNAQSTSVQSSTQQNLALQVNEDHKSDTMATAENESAAAAVSLSHTKNVASQDGSIVLNGASSITGGDNTMMDSQNLWGGISQSAQDSGTQSLTQQNVALQVNGGSEGDTTASADNQSNAIAINLASEKNVASQSGQNFALNLASNVSTGNNAIADSQNGWKGLSQNAQSSGVLSLTQQNVALQWNEGDKSATSASADSQSEALAVALYHAGNIANQTGLVDGNSASTISTGGNAITDSQNNWKGLSQNAQNSGVLSLTQQNVAVQWDEGKKSTSAFAKDQSGAAAVALSGASNIASQAGAVNGNYAGIFTTGNNTVQSSYDGWKGISQNAQDSGVQSLTQQNMAVQASTDKPGAEATADDSSLAIAVNVGATKNWAEQSGTIRYNSISPAEGTTGNNTLQSSYNGWKGMSQNAQNSGLQSLIQQNAAVQVNDGDSQGVVAMAEDHALALAGNGSLRLNAASQDGIIVDNNVLPPLNGSALGFTTGDNTIDQSFNSWSGISQNAQNSGAQSMIQQNAAVQVNTGGQEIEVAGVDAALALALNVDLAANVATQEGSVTFDFLSTDVQTGDNTISGSGSFNGWSGISQSVQNSGVHSMVQQNVAVQANVNR